MSQLPQLNKTKQLRAEVDKLPERDFSPATLKSEEEWRRAYTMLCMLGQSYIWGEGQKGLINKVPKKLAIPWCRVSDHFSMKPVVNFAVMCLYNFSLRYPEKPWNSDNLRANSLFTGTEDESWFYVVGLLVELAGVPALRAITQVFEGMAHQRDEDVQKYLQTIQLSIQAMTKELGRMYEGCDPVVFYVDIRPFQAGSKGLDAFPEGIIFEGMDSEPHQYHGASAGQSSIIHALDIFLGAKHSGNEKNFLEAMRSYMPSEHREFLAHLERMPSVEEYCKRTKNIALISSYNSAVKELANFRNDHFVLVTRYIINQRQHSVNSTLDTKGSGGTDFMKFLKNVRNSTLELLTN